MGSAGYTPAEAHVRDDWAICQRNQNALSIYGRSPAGYNLATRLQTKGFRVRAIYCSLFSDLQNLLGKWYWPTWIRRNERPFSFVSRNAFVESISGLQVSMMCGHVTNTTNRRGLVCGSILNLTHILDNCNGWRCGGQIEIPSLLEAITLKLHKNGRVCRPLFGIL